MAGTEVEPTKAEVKRRGNYSISVRLAKALTLLASGEAKTQAEACEGSGLSSRALRAALRRDNVRAYMQEKIMTTLGIGAMRAATKMTELLDSPNAMASYHASRFTLATGAGVVMPEQPAVNVNIGLGDIRPGFILDLSEPSPPLRVIEGGPIIDGTVDPPAGAA